MKKVLIAVIAVVVLFPLIPVLLHMLPEPLTMERAQRAFENSGMTVSDVRKTEAPGLGAVEQMSMYVNGALVEIYRFDDEGALATQLEYQKPDSGSAIVETWNLSESLGAAKPKNNVSADRNGMFMITVTSDDKALRQRIITVFGSA